MVLCRIPAMSRRPQFYELDPYEVIVPDLGYDTAPKMVARRVERKPRAWAWYGGTAAIGATKTESRAMAECVRNGSEGRQPRPRVIRLALGAG